ncbi:MAG: prepilin-type N-terminal cleavage/methylation domain-containing protein [Actinobacteria bacterium]|nr:prepilin-type N-terminal cleavage/methylation domain-containing protein [Actinomycetota bacterium]
MLLNAIRRRVGDERGFTLIELLVVILIIGILAAIAIPSFLSQKDKANDASAKSYARNLQTAQETYFTDNNTYATALSALVTIEPALNEYPSTTAPPRVDAADSRSFTIEATSKAGVTYTITRNTDGTLSRTCGPRSTGGCNADGTW